VSEEPNNQTDEEANADTAADVKAIIIAFAALVAMAVHFASGFTFDL
jgi:hypothetical protein